jgi:GR25 family glycosyltransferase involved in LPS biosynthesis
MLAGPSSTRITFIDQDSWGMTLPVYVLNLDRDTDRLAAMSRQIARHDFLAGIRVPAFAGRQLPDHACHILTGNPWSHHYKGTLGCFISHMMAWQKIAAHKQAFALVAEDSAVFSHIDLLRHIAIPADAELVFCNRRTAYPDDEPAEPETALYQMRFRPVDPVPAFIETHGRAVGTEGYVLTPAGAAKLLRFVAADRLFSHVDLRLLAYCLEPNDPPIPASFQGAGRTVLQFRREFRHQHHVRAYSMWPPVTDRPFDLSSTRAHEDQAGMCEPAYA